MKVARFVHRDAAGARIGRVEGDTLVEVDADDVIAGVSGPETGRRFVLADARLLAPIPRPPKFLAIGFNYKAHLEETGTPAPEFPVFFNKQSTCVTGPYDPIVLPKASSFVDYEGELGVVIGHDETVAGYLVVDDVSARDWQLKAPTMTLGKSFDTHGPIGPWLVTPDEVGDPHALQLRTYLNGELVQDASTGDMLFDIPAQLDVLTTACTLEYGDVIATGTPSGVGIARTPPVSLADGDVVRVEIDRVGAIENPVVDQ